MNKLSKCFNLIKNNYDSYKRYKIIRKNMETLFPRLENENFKDEICPICHDELLLARKITECGHVFHIKCLFQWLKNS